MLNEKLELKKLTKIKLMADKLYMNSSPEKRKELLEIIDEVNMMCREHAIYASIVENKKKRNK